MKNSIIKFIFLLSLLMTSLTVSAAPSIPAEVLNNGLIYCASNNDNAFYSGDVTNSNVDIVTTQIYNKLFNINPKTNKIEGELATSYKFLDNNTTLIISLRKNVKFHHTQWFTPSRDFNADDVVFSLTRLFSNKLTLSPKIIAIEKLNEHQVKIRLSEIDSSLLPYLSSHVAIIYSAEYARTLTAKNKLSDLYLYPIGTGAYQMKSFFFNQYVRLQRNPQYWAKKAKIENIVVDFSNNQAGRLLKFLNNECQITSSPELSQLKILEQLYSNDHYLYKRKNMNLTYLVFNFNKPLMQDENIRHAISQAINRQRIVDTLYYGTAQVTNEIIPQGSWAYKPDSNNFNYDYNPQRALKMLRPLNLTINLWVLSEEHLYNQSPIETAEIIKYDLNQAGVKVVIHYLTHSLFKQSLQQNKADYDLLLTGWLSNNLEPNSFMLPILSCNGQPNPSNLSHWCNNEFNQNINQALASNNRTQNIKRYNQAQKIVLEQLPILPLVKVDHILIVNNRVQGLKNSFDTSFHFADLSLKTEAK